VNSWNPAINGVSATAADWQNLANDIAAALTQSLSSDGQTPVTGNLPMTGNKLTGLGAGSATGDSLRWEQLFSQGTPQNLASAATTDIGAQNSVFLNITGTTTITSFGTNYNGPRYIRFDGALTLTHNATTLILPGAANITTAAGDSAIVVPSGSPANGWRVAGYQKADGSPISIPNGSVTPAKLSTGGLFWDASGNVGIGTTSPAAKLHVYNSNDNVITATRDLDVTTVGAAAAFINLGARSGTTATNAATVAGILNNPATTGHLSFFTRSSNTLTERLRVDSDGSQTSVIPGGSTLLPQFACRAWVNFNGTGTVAIRASGNVSSITDNGTGNYTVNFTTSMPDANYAITYGFDTDQDNVNQFATSSTPRSIYSQQSLKTTSNFRIFCGSNAAGGSVALDFRGIDISVFR
jgi:hypothetical protein